MDHRAFLLWLAEHLDRAGIAYMISGSVASTFHGEHRATNDVDVVVSPSPKELEVFLDSIGADFYVSQAAARRALRDRTMFNIIHPATGLKADLIVRKDRPFSVEEFARRRRAPVLGVNLSLVSAEDIILSKLEWARMAQSERQIRDALGVVIVQLNTLNLEYLRKWGRELGIGDILEEILQQARQKQEPSEGEGP